MLLDQASADFADETKAFNEITSTRDAEQLQEDLSDQVTWSDSVSLNFTYSKCKVQRITRKLKPASRGKALILIALQKRRLFIHHLNYYFDAWQSQTFQLDFSLNHCMLLLPLFRLLPAISLLTSAAISVDRLLVLLLGLTYRHTLTLRRVWVITVCFLLTSALQAA